MWLLTHPIGRFVLFGSFATVASFVIMLLDSGRKPDDSWDREDD
jgi:hypothetical protein